MQAAKLVNEGIEVILVSSGAVGAGLGLLKTGKKHKSLSELQAIASIGQNCLMDTYNDCFKKTGHIAGQILLTQEDFNDRNRFLNIRYTLNTLLKFGAIPIVNENDSVSTLEMKCGDNDRLSSLVADLADSDMLIILTDVEGLYDEDGDIIDEVEKVTNKIKSLSKGKRCDVSTGGMTTKLESVEKATLAGIESYIVRGKRKNAIIDIVKGKKVGTRFASQGKSIKAKKRWIAHGSKSKGAVTLDTGAVKAIVDKNKSLLPSGVVSANGQFASGDVIDIIDKKKHVVARGLTNYSKEEVLKIKGKRSDMIEKELGYKDYDEVVHRDNLVVIDQ